MMFLLLLAKFKIDIDKMKEKEKGIALLMGLVFMGMGAHAQTEPLKRMAIMSDVHLMAPELLKKKGKHLMIISYMIERCWHKAQNCLILLAPTLRNSIHR